MEQDYSTRDGVSQLNLNNSFSLSKPIFKKRLETKKINKYTVDRLKTIQ